MCASGIPPPRYIRPDATYAIERRIERRRLLLRPDAELNNLFRWVIAVTANEFDVEVHVVNVMSNHFHLVVTVPNENVSDFVHRLDLRLARALQVYRRFANGVIWEPGKLSIVELETPEAVIEAIAYAMVNPVAAGLVYAPEDWPGVTASVDDIGTADIAGTIPPFYFDPKNWPEADSTPLMIPSYFRDDPETFRELLAAEVELQTVEARAEVKRKGWEVLGRVRAMNVSPHRRAKSWEDFRKVTPHIAAGRGQNAARIAAIERLREFRLAHREAKARWIVGDRDVVFPAGTHWMRVHHRARVAPFD